MSRIDIVIFGATGFTGRKAVEEAVRLAKTSGFTWAVAGRDQNKLDALLTDVGNRTGEDISSIKKIIADVKDEVSLKDMTSQAKLVANCCGPYRMFGEPVIKACILTGTHHVDVSGEPQFIESMQLKYDKMAKEAGVYVVSACGFDSVPNDLGVMFLKDNFGGVLNSVESYLSVKIPPEFSMAAFKSGTIHYGTWESLVYSLGHWQELSPLRKQLFPERLPTFKPKLEARRLLHKRDGRWCLPFPGADNSIVYRTQRQLHAQRRDRPVQFKAYMKQSNLFTALLVIFNAIILYFMAAKSFTRQLLLDYPRLFSMGMVTRRGPKEEVMNNTFFRFELIGTGWENGADVENTPPTKKVVAMVRGVNPGYGATVSALLCAALTLLTQTDRMPGPGVLTTGVAFQKTDIITKLNENNLTFEIVKD